MNGYIGYKITLTGIYIFQGTFLSLNKKSALSEAKRKKMDDLGGGGGGGQGQALVILLRRVPGKDNRGNIYLECCNK